MNRIIIAKYFISQKSFGKAIIYKKRFINSKTHKTDKID